MLVALSCAVTACGGDDVATSTATAERAEAVGDDDCPVIGATQLAAILDMPTPTVLQGGPESCLWSFTGADTTLGSILVADAAMGQGLLDTLADYDEEGLSLFGVERIEDVDDVEGTYSGAGFVAVVRDEVTYQFALDGPSVDRSDRMLELVRVLARSD